MSVQELQTGIHRLQGIAMLLIIHLQEVLQVLLGMEYRQEEVVQ